MFERSQRIRPKNKIHKLFFECNGKGTEIDYIGRAKILLKRDIAATISVGKAHNSSLSDLLEAAKKFPSGKKGNTYIIIDNDRQQHDGQHQKRLNDIFTWVKENPKQRFCLVSNPNFELWLLLHFEDKPEKISLIKAVLKKHRAILDDGTKHINKSSFTLGGIEAAINRAKTIDNPPCETYPSCHGSTVYKLMEKLIEANKRCN